MIQPGGGICQNSGIETSIGCGPMAGTHGGRGGCVGCGPCSPGMMGGMGGQMGGQMGGGCSNKVVCGCESDDEQWGGAQFGQQGGCGCIPCGPMGMGGYGMGMGGWRGC